MGSYFGVWKKYAEFSGRATRKEYWMFTLFDQLITWGLYIPLLMSDYEAEGSEMGALTAFSTLIILIYSVAVFLPRLAVSVRRLHDSGKSGFMVLLGIIPMIGGIIMLVMLVQESDPGENEYGYPVHIAYDRVFE
jgi:uncharacterized membrane protein YhaH (DUF805 family)